MKLFPMALVVFSGMIVIGGYCHATTISVSANQPATRLFRVDYAPTVPVPIRPINDELINSHEDSLWVWNSFDADNDSLTYDYQLFCACCGLIEALFYYDVPEGYDSTGVTAYMLDVQDENCQVLWRARANDGSEYSDWCEVQSYYVNNEEESPADFGLIWPPDTGWSQVYDFPVMFQWRASSDPDPLDSVYYRLKIATDSNFTFTATYDSIYQPNSTVPSLEYCRHYWWKVSAVDTKGNVTPSSGVADFMTWILGDANADFSVNIGDGVFLINYIFKGGAAPYPLKIGDVNADCEINIADAVYLISYIFKGGPPPAPGCAE